jgi:signal transduction histidine kinase
MVSGRADELFTDHERLIHERTDRLFAGLMPLQWAGAVAAACWLSPYAWAGESRSLHLHVWLALVYGGIITLYPVILALTRPGLASTRHVIAVAQILMSSLLIHVSGGRIETHFHVFGSLAFLAFYRDWRVLLSATLVVALDHSIRGIFWPQSVYGVLAASPWRSVEHTAWVVFEDVFLVIAGRQCLREMRDIAEQRAELESTNRRVELTVAARTRDLQEAMAELARSNSELLQFAAAASHDLQEPLRKIIAFGGRLRERLDGALDDEAQDYLRRMRLSAERMGALIEDLLTLARVSAKPAPLREVELTAIARDILSDMETAIAESGGRVELAALPSLDADPVQMRQILQNLIANSIKFHKKGAPPVVEVRGALLGDGYCEITVRDNGIGFEEKYLDRIFKPFQRLHSRSEYAGTGMGLAICEKIAARHGGTISARSAPGLGSLFTVRLPAHHGGPG